MEKTIKLFIKEAPIWQIFTSIFLIISIILFLGLSFLNLFFTLGFLTFSIIKISISFGLFFGTASVISSTIKRKSCEFWSAAETLECKIEVAKDKKSIDSLFKNDFQDLRKMCQGSPHNEEIVKLYSIMKTKYKYVK
jgi:uncharacterized membrane protein